MSLKKTVTALFSAAGIMILILDGQTALQGAAAGISLCLRTVIPSLFPFLFLCSVLTDSLWGTTFWSGKLLRRLGIPAGADSLLISAILGGYPAGAQAVAAAYQQGKLSRKEASHLLRFCSNAGPSFLFGMAASCFP